MSHFIFRNIPVVGGFYRSEEEQQTAKALKAGDPVQLCAEADNEHDPLAVAVTANGHHIGYIPAHSSGAVLLIAALIEGEAAEIQACVTGTSKQGWPLVSAVLELEEE